MRMIKRRPVCAICVLIVISVYIYVSSPLWELGRSIYNPGGNNIFTQAGIKEGDQITLTGRVYSRQLRELGGREVMAVSLKGVRGINGIKLTGISQSVTVYFAPDEDIRIGQLISLKGKLEYFDHARNPGEFDMYEFSTHRGILFGVYSGKVTEAGKRYSKIREALYHIRLKGEERLSRYLSKEDSAIMKGMLFGNKNEIDNETKELFARNGIAHTLAISGLHISFLAMTLYNLLKKSGLKTWICAIISETVLILYGIMVGFSVSALRAILMFTILILGKVILRTYDILTSMCLVLIIILIFSPGLIMDTSLRLSFMAVFSVGYLYNAFNENIISVPDKLSGMAVSTFVFLGTLPILSSIYYEVAFYSIALNLIIIPLMSVLLMSTICIFSPIALLSSKLTTLILMLYKGTCSVLEGTGAGRVNIGAPLIIEVVIFYILLVLSVNVRLKSRVKGVALSITLMLMAVSVLTYRPHMGMRISMIDVGQGDSMLIQNDNGHAYLIDGGSTTVKSVGDRRIIPLIKYYGINSIEGIILTHPDEDHMNGIAKLLDTQSLEHIKVKRLYIYEGFENCEELKDILDIARASGVQVKPVHAGYKISDDKLELEVIYPTAGVRTDEYNNASLVSNVRYGDFTLLATGDLETPGEERVMLTDGLTPVDVLKVAHHGSSGSSSDKFLNTIHPKVALISVGKDNSYGHPHKETLARLNNAKAVALRTDELGCISINVRKKDGRFTIKGYLETQK